ncbi:MAG: glucokinase [Thermoanaerobaculia bacterium]
MILAGDVGGSNVRIALFERDGSRLVEKARKKLPTRSVASLPEVVGEFMGEFVAAQGGTVSAAGFGIAGPVRNNRCEAPNLPWVVEGEALARGCGLDTVVLVNDLMANAIGLSELSEADFDVINAGTPDPNGNGALISAGTGLGMAALIRHGDRFLPQPSEGGHASFAPNGPDELALLTFLSKTYAHVSFERVLSGPGLVNVHRFELSRSGAAGPDPLEQSLKPGGDFAAAIAQAALLGTNETAERALRRFAGLYGSAAGNLALTVLATGGVFLGGGIAPKIRARLVDGTFLDAFCQKGRFAALLRAVPVKIILNDACALIGAARAAADSVPRPAA